MTCPAVAATDVSGWRCAMTRHVASTIKSSPTPMAEKISPSMTPLYLELSISDQSPTVSPWGR